MLCACSKIFRRYFIPLVWCFTLSSSAAIAGDFATTWGTAPYTWPNGGVGPTTITFTDQYGFQTQVRYTITQVNGSTVAGYPNDVTGFGTGTTIGVVWDPGVGGSIVGGSPNTALMEILNGGAALPVNNLRFRVDDIDAVDNNNASFAGDRCDFVTITGNNGNPTITAVNASPTYIIGPGAGAGSTGALAANQAQCNFQTSTSVNSGTSSSNNNGSIQLAFPNNTSTATVVYDESIRNVASSASVDAAARGVGVWGNTTFTVNNTITLDKQTSSVDFTAAGQVINYTYVVTNNGPLTILTTQNIQIQDNKVGTFTCPAVPAAGITSGGTLICTATYTTTAADVTANQVVNIARAGVGTGTQAFAARLQSNADTVTVPKRTTLTLAKTVINDNGGTRVDADFTLVATGPSTISGVEGAPAVTNATVIAGNYTLSESGVGVAGYGASWSCPGATLSGTTLTLTAGQSITCTATNNDISPTLRLRKVSNGGVATFNFNGTNGFGTDAIPTVTAGVLASGVLKNLSSSGVVTDITETPAAGYFISGTPTCTGLGSGTVSLLSGTTYRISSAALVPGATIQCDFSNTLAVPQLTMTKSPNVGSVGTAGQTVTYTVAVTNSGNVPATGIALTDPLGTVVCPTSGNNTIANLAVGASVSCSMTYTVPQAVFDNNGGGDGDIDNTVSVTGSTTFGSVSQTASAAVTLSGAANLSLAKAWTFAPGGDVNGNGRADRNDIIAYTYTVTNGGNRTITGVGINDAHNGYGIDPVPGNEVIFNDIAPLGNSTDAAANASWDTLAPGDSVRFRANYTVVQQDIDLLQ